MDGLTGDRDQVWDQSDLAGSGRDPFDFFGNSVAVGDFNGDGFDDLVVGSPGEAQNAGVVHAMFGSPSGLTTNGNQRWRQDADGIQGNRENNDLFGFELATGDFNGDGNDDLAVGVPGEDNNGGVAVLFGTSGGGLRGDGNLFLAQGENGIPDRRERNDAFGSVLATGDFNGDGYAELAIASINEDNGRGVVIVLPGSSSGPTGNGSVDWRQGSNGLQDSQNDGDRFGTSLVAGDFNGDGYQDMAVGARGEDNNRGIVQVIYGSGSGLTADGNQLFTEGFEGLAGEANSGDDFGTALAAGNFGFDAAQDLAIGAPREEGNQDRGSVYAIYGFGLDIVGAGLSRPSVFEGSYNMILSAFGPRFAPAGTAATGRLVNGRLETNVGGVCVEMDGQRAPIFATFENQINFQASVTPDQSLSIVHIVSKCGTPSERRSLPIPLTVLEASPEFFFFSLTQDGRNPVAAIDNNTGELLGPGFRGARRGDVVTIFLTGLGETSTRFLPGELANAAATTVHPVTIEVGGRVYQPAYAGVSPGFAGLYQVSFVLAQDAPAGDLDVTVTVQTSQGPISTPAGAYLRVQ
ncbi:MAG: FG-GAP-like repeat-containing protein [Bryobacterales bacterium]